jgi:hypothetical protein
MATAMEKIPPHGTALATTEDAVITPMSLIQSAIMQGASIDTIERLAKLQREMVEYEAKVAFDKAMGRAQNRMKRIGTDATNPQTHSRYATYSKLDGAVRPIYTEEGFALSFDTGDAPPDTVRVLCYASHSSGYTRTYKVDMPSDGKGAKGGDVMTKTHATGAAMSYGQRYLLKMIFNLSIGDTDDDGNGASSAAVPEEQVTEHIAYMENARTTSELQTYFARAYKIAEAAKDREAAKSFIAARDKIRKVLNANR